MVLDCNEIPGQEGKNSQGGEAQHRQVHTFSFQDLPVRTIVIRGEPWFIASDVAKALGYLDAGKAIRSHCKGVSKSPYPSAGGDQMVNIIREGDVFRLVMKSKLPEAQAFEAKVMDEILPALRRGEAVLAAPGPASGLEVVAQIGSALGILAQKGKEHEAQILDLRTGQQTLASKIEAMESRQAEVTEMTGLLPEPTKEVPEVPTRGAINAIIRSHAILSGKTFQEAWNDFYTQIYYRTHVSVKERARHREITPMVVLEQDGLMETAYAIAVGVYGKGKVS